MDAAPLEPAIVNDQQSRLNRTRVAGIFRPRSIEEIREALRQAKRRSLVVAVCGGRHAMGGQQFAANGLLLDLSDFQEVLALDTAVGRVRAQAGIRWPTLMRELDSLQRHDRRPWCIRQKQTGVDEVSLGGSVGANAHGRGLDLPPLVDDVEAITLMGAEGDLHRCSRAENPGLFALAVGGYGCFGIVVEVELRLVRRQTVQRRVEAIAVADLVGLAQARLAEGAVYGDCQYATHLSGAADEHPGLLSVYHPVEGEPDADDPAMTLSAERWTTLIRLARRDKERAFAFYREHYLRTDGRRYASDRHQLSPVFDGYLKALETDGKAPRGTEMITEVYVEPDRLMDFLGACRGDFARHGVDMTYGTIRLIKPDEVTFLPWATQRWACVVVNLHVKHDAAGIDAVRTHFRRILDRTVERGGSFYLTYHRWAERTHLDAAYPQMPEWLSLKRRHDPMERFASDWYRHLKSLYPEVSG